jgi:hypothetical protein
MNRNDFLRMIENSGPADRNMIVEVNELIDIFPYFQSAYILLLKGLQNTSDVKFDNQLRTWAMHIADREVLYYFLKKEPVVEDKTDQSGQINVFSAGDTGDSQQTVIESARNSQDLIDEIEKNSNEEKTEDRPKDHSILITAEDNFDGSDAAVFIIDEESGFVEEKVIYMDPGFSVPEETELLELDIENNSLIGQFTETSNPESQIPENTPNVKQLQTELIDKFIIANPRIEPVRDKSDKPAEDISKPYVEEQGGFVTETLARIYINQGYYSRAIDIYEKLSLKFPEKSSYFASQIEKVKELIKK